MEQDKELKKQDAELREYQKKSMVVRAVLAVAALAATALTGFIGKKRKFR
jgi:hypothetical protein